MARDTDFNTGAADWKGLSIKLSADDRAKLVTLTHKLGKNASEVIRCLIRDAVRVQTGAPE